jgi:hypothetical protein
MQQGSSASWWDSLVAGLSQKQAQAPPSPEPPPVDQGAWERSVEQKHLKDMTVHDVRLVVFNESQSYSDRPDSNERIDAAREKMAHSVINADTKWGAARQQHAKTASPIEPTDSALRNPATRAAYNSSMRAAREAYLSGTDPTNGAVHLNQRDSPDRSNLKFAKGNPQGVTLSTQSGPYNNSYTKGQVASSRVWLNSYFDK